MLPFAVTLIPTFLMWRAIGFTNSFVPLIAPAWFGGGAFYIFLLRQFYMTIPKDFDEAAYLDGANHFQIFTRIILPITKPSLAVVGLFTFMNTWNDFLGPLASALYRLLPFGVALNDGGSLPRADSCYSGIYRRTAVSDRGYHHVGRQRLRK